MFTLLLALTLFQEPVVRYPTVVELGHTYTSTDYAAITGFELGYFSIPATPDGLSCQETATPAAQPVQVVTFGKPGYAGGTVSGPIPARPFGCWRVRARALASGLMSDWSPLSNPFAVPPAPPSPAVVR